MLGARPAEGVANLSSMRSVKQRLLDTRCIPVLVLGTAVAALSFASCQPAERASEHEPGEVVGQPLTWTAMAETTELALPSAGVRSGTRDTLLNGIWPARRHLFVAQPMTLSVLSLDGRARCLSLRLAPPSELAKRHATAKIGSRPLALETKQEGAIRACTPAVRGPHVHYLELAGLEDLDLVATRLEDTLTAGSLDHAENGDLILRGNVVARAALAASELPSELVFHLEEVHAQDATLEVWQDSTRLLSLALRDRQSGDRGATQRLQLGRAVAGSTLDLLLRGSGSVRIAAPLLLAEHAPTASAMRASLLDLEGATAPATVVVIVLDALRADYADLVGPTAEPAISLLPRDRLDVLELPHHRAVAPNTLPSTKALFTGHTWRQAGGWSLAAYSGPTLAEIFARHGYLTALVSHNPYVSSDYGVDRGFARDLSHPPHHELDSANDDSAQVLGDALSLIETVDRDQPLFLYVHALNPHNPYTAPSEAPSASQDSGSAAALDGTTKLLLDVDAGRRDLNAAGRLALRRLYARGIAYAADQIRRFVTALAKRRDLDATLFVVTADHGEELFDHGGVLHGYTLYEEQLRIPLLLAWKGVTPSSGIDPLDHRQTTTLDLHRLLVAVAQLAPAASEAAPSTGFGLMAQATTEIRFAAAASVRGGVFSATAGNTKVIWAPRSGRSWGPGSRLGRSRDVLVFFDLEADPAELEPAYAPRSRADELLFESLRAWVAADLESADHEDTEPGAPASQKKRIEELKKLGYVTD